MSTPYDDELVSWLETIADEEERRAVAAAFEIAGAIDYVETDDDRHQPFVYPH